MKVGLLPQPWRLEQWLGPRQPVKAVVKNRFGPKVTLCIWWNFVGVMHWEFVPNGRAVDADKYSQQLERVHEILRRRCTALVNRNTIVLQQDNARPHTALRTVTKIQELGGIEMLPHPTYSPGFAPSNYNLFRSMVHFLSGRNFEKIEAAEEVKVKVSPLQATRPTALGWGRMASRTLGRLYPRGNSPVLIL